LPCPNGLNMNVQKFCLDSKGSRGPVGCWITVGLFPCRPVVHTTEGTVSDRIRCRSSNPCGPHSRARVGPRPPCLPGLPPPPAAELGLHGTHRRVQEGPHPPGLTPRRTPRPLPPPPPPRPEPRPHAFAPGWGSGPAPAAATGGFGSASGRMRGSGAPSTRRLLPKQSGDRDPSEPSTGDRVASDPPHPPRHRPGEGRGPGGDGPIQPGFLHIHPPFRPISLNRARFRHKGVGSVAISPSKGGGGGPSCGPHVPLTSPSSYSLAFSRVPPHSLCVSPLLHLCPKATASS